MSLRFCRLGILLKVMQCHISQFAVKNGPENRYIVEKVFWFHHSVRTTVELSRSSWPVEPMLYYQRAYKEEVHATIHLLTIFKYFNFITTFSLHTVNHSVRISSVEYIFEYQSFSEFCGSFLEVIRPWNLCLLYWRGRIKRQKCMYSFTNLFKEMICIYKTTVLEVDYLWNSAWIPESWKGRSACNY